MTCIIGHRDGWMVADVAHSFTDLTRCPCYTSKVLFYAVPNTGGRMKFIWASCGNSVLYDKTATAIREDSPSPLGDLAGVFREFRNEGEALVVCSSGDIYQISTSGALLKMEAEYWAIGSGYQAALGFLRGQGHDAVSINDAKQAIAFAAELCTDVSEQTTHLTMVDFG